MTPPCETTASVMPMSASRVPTASATDAATTSQNMALNSAAHAIESERRPLRHEDGTTWVE